MIFHHTDFTQLSLSLAGYSKSNTKATHLCVIGGPNPQVLLLIGIGVGGVGGVDIRNIVGTKIIIILFNCFVVVSNLTDSSLVSI